MSFDLTSQDAKRLAALFSKIRFTRQSCVCTGQPAAENSAHIPHDACLRTVCTSCEPLEPAQTVLTVHQTLPVGRPPTRRMRRLRQRQRLHAGHSPWLGAVARAHPLCNPVGDLRPPPPKGAPPLHPRGPPPPWRPASTRTPLRAPLGAPLRRACMPPPSRRGAPPLPQPPSSPPCSNT